MAEPQVTGNFIICYIKGTDNTKNPGCFVILMNILPHFLTFSAEAILKFVIHLYLFNFNITT